MNTHTIAAAIALLVATPAGAATITRNGDRIILTGTIQPGDDTAFAAALDDGVKTVVLGSDGGHVNEAITIGRAIRSQGLDTVVPSSCMSACVLVWSAGKTRAVGGVLRVHCPTQPGSPYQCDTLGRERMIRYLREMDAPAGVVRMQEAVNWLALQVTPEQLAEAPEVQPRLAQRDAAPIEEDEPVPPPRRRPRPRYHDEPPPYYGPAPLPPGWLIMPPGRPVPCALTVLTFGAVPVCI
jgi:hypothetical protein